MAFSIKVNTNETNVDKVNNTSYVHVEVLGTTTGGSWNMTGSAFVQGNITAQNNTITIPKTTFNIQKNVTNQLLYSGTLGPFTHNSDGSLNPASVYVFAQLVSGTTKSSAVSCSMSTIPRAGTLTVNKRDLKIGEDLIIYTNRQNDDFTHKLYYQPESGSWTLLASGVTTSYTWSLQQSLLSHFLSGWQCRFNLKCETYSGDTYIGESTTSVFISARDEIDAPNYTVSFSEGNSVVANSGVGMYIKGLSKIKATLTNISKCYNSPLDSITMPVYRTESQDYEFQPEAKAVDGSATTVTIESKTITKTGQYTVTPLLYDERMAFPRKDKATTITVVDYEVPKILSVNAVRCNSSGVESESGTYLKYTFVASITSLNNKNAKKYEIGYKTKGSSTYQYKDLQVSSYNLNRQGQILSGVTLNNNYVYDIQFRVTDSFGEVHIDQELGADFKLINFNASGKSLAFGTISNRNSSEKYADFDLTVNCMNGLKLDGTDIITKINSLINSAIAKISSYGMLIRKNNQTYEDSSTWTFHTIQFDDVYNWNGNNYLINSGDGQSITIGSNVSVVEVSGWVAIYEASNLGAIEVGINKNGVSTGIICFGEKAGIYNTTTYYIPPTPLSVSQGDKITMTFCNASGGTTILYSTSSRPAIAMKIKVIK